MNTEKTFSERLEENNKKLLALLTMPVDMKSIEYKTLKKDAYQEHSSLMKEAKQLHKGVKLPKETRELINLLK